MNIRSMAFSLLIARSFKSRAFPALHNPTTKTSRAFTISTTKLNPVLSMSSTTEISTSSVAQSPEASEQVKPPMYLAEGIFSVMKPIEWTSNDVVSYIRGMLERDAKDRGVKVTRPNKRKRFGKSKSLKVGHGGTLDPLATGVLVVGVGSGTRELQNYLHGSKKYVASIKFGEETDTLDIEGKVVKTAPFEHVTADIIEETLSKFRGEIMQVPPIFSALKSGGKKLYELAREGQTAEDVGIEARPVVIHKLELIKQLENGPNEPPSFELEIECGGGTYIRSLVRDIAHSIDSCATMTSLIRTKQGQFKQEGTLEKNDWTVENIYEKIKQENENRSASLEIK